MPEEKPLSGFLSRYTFKVVDRGCSRREAKVRKIGGTALPSTHVNTSSVSGIPGATHASPAKMGRGSG